MLLRKAFVNLHLLFEFASLYSYIKPQLGRITYAALVVVYPYIPTSNRNLWVRITIALRVVYPYIPTSNRNMALVLIDTLELYILIFLHQTATLIFAFNTLDRLYILIFLHQTATVLSLPTVHVSCISLYSYIKPQLYNTLYKMMYCCISLYSYIKPQPVKRPAVESSVVYPYIPTSNRNRLCGWRLLGWLYILIFLHQTAT